MMANIITAVRIVCSIALLFFPGFSPAFYTLYIVAGISDILDGTVARKTGTISEFGSKLDTVADFVLIPLRHKRNVFCLPRQKAFFSAFWAKIGQNQAK